MTKTRLSTEERLTKIREQQKQLDLEGRRLEKRFSEEQRKRDTRRKILAGSCLLHMVQIGKVPEPEFKTWIGGFLTKDADRSLFDLPPSDKDNDATATD